MKDTKLGKIIKLNDIYSISLTDFNIIDINLVFADSSMKIISDSVSFKFLPAHKMPCFFKINASFSIIFSDAFKASSLLPGFS